MSALRRDDQGIIDTALVAFNANDRNADPTQHNLLPLAQARGVGVIAMKIFGEALCMALQGTSR